ncbi:YkvA family protein [Psychrobacillus sp. FJAT-21963]|uniref:YkvA family protein n=1 Tax=Psychrobacillus sp. FJAT-21963 TaxID=1712028 RepID=UPI000AE0E9CB|nr:YkvA family protein [Psychrobacillus sp. FJAT-21963]
MISRLKAYAKKIKQEIFVLVEAYKHPELPLYIKLLSLLIVAYAFSPIDLIPDFIPVLGYIDDLILIPLAISIVMRLIPNNILNDCRNLAEKSEKVKRNNWFAGIVIISLWISCIYLLFILFTK